LAFPKHPLSPQELLIFIEMSDFLDDWADLGLDVEFDLLALQIQLMVNPKQGVVVPGSGGLRKLDFSPPAKAGKKRRGKRNACRVAYAYFEEFHTILLVIAYAKSNKADFTGEEKEACKRAIARVRRSLSARYYT
jgi:hypothetical protein